ncbi:MAG: site-specific integrase [Pseudomonadota bacterium]
MKLSQSVDYCLNYHRQNSKKSTLGNYESLLSRFKAQFEHREINTITPDEVLAFLSTMHEKCNQTTKRFRYSMLNAFFNLIKNTVDENMKNPCDTMMLRKIFRNSRGKQWTMLERETVDEMIFKTEKPRNRIMLELMARGGMRIGEVLKIRPMDIEDHKIILHSPKSGKESEVVYMPQKIADRLKEYVRLMSINGSERIFPLKYSGAREIVKRASKKTGINIRPHDLRRYAATYASRSGTPIEIVSKVILRHSNLSTTQRYLGKVSETEAVRWIENLYR